MDDYLMIIHVYNDVFDDIWLVIDYSCSWWYEWWFLTRMMLFMIVDYCWWRWRYVCMFRLLRNMIIHHRIHIVHMFPLKETLLKTNF